jgi:membrane protein
MKTGSLRLSRRGTLGRLKAVSGVILSRDTGVITNAIAFNFLLCLFPLLLVLVAVVQQLPAGRRLIPGLLVVLEEVIPFEAQAMALTVERLRKLARGLEALSLVMIAWGSSGIFIPVEMALNRVWGGRARPFLKSRLLAFLMTVAGGILAFASLGLTVAARAYREQWPFLAESVAKASALLLTYLLFFLIYRVVPDPPVGSRTAGKAALWGGSAWELVKYLFVINLARTNLHALYGPLAFAVALVLWAYVSSLTLVFGALMAPTARRKGSERPAARKGA